jgi:hypothetical protein
MWRSQAATQNPDQTLFEKAYQQLQRQVRDIVRPEQQDYLWAETQESIGDYWWASRNRNWSAAWPSYQNALLWWGKSSDIKTARKRYLGIVWKSNPVIDPKQYGGYGYYGNYLQIDVIENAVKIASTPEEKAQAHYLLAITLRQQGGNPQQLKRVPLAFETALKIGRSTHWYDDALFQYAEFQNSHGKFYIDENGQSRQEPDYPKALELYQRFTTEFSKGESRYYDQAIQRIKQISEPTLSLQVGNFFLPGSEIQFHASWRNLDKIEFSVFKFDLVKDVDLRVMKPEQRQQWFQNIDPHRFEKIQSWTKTIEGSKDYKPGQDSINLDKKLPLGAYLVKASGNGKSAYELILVTDAILIVKSSGKKLLAFLTDALNGAPITGADIVLWDDLTNDDGKRITRSEQKSNADGICEFNFEGTSHHRQFIACASYKGRQAFNASYHHDHQRDRDGWKVYAFTDRPAYRPGETVQWKWIIRKHNGKSYTTPAIQTIEFEIWDPQGSKIKEGKAFLNAYGSAWGSQELTESMPLGEYRVQLWDEGRRYSIGSANLFRLEEYKLPEFKVRVQTPEEKGQRKIFRLGDSVEVSINADYYCQQRLGGSSCLPEPVLSRLATSTGLSVVLRRLSILSLPLR